MKIKSLFASSIISGIALSSISHAVVTNFAINQTHSQGTGQFDIGSTINIGGAGSFTLDPGSSEQFFDFQFSSTGTFSTYGVASSGYFFLESFAAGATVDLSSLGIDESSVDDWDTILVNGVTDGVWNSSHSGNIGFISDGGNYGYIAYDYTRSGGVSTLNLLNGAYESNIGQGITIAAVPETSSTLLGVISMVFLLRRRRA